MNFLDGFLLGGIVGLVFSLIVALIAFKKILIKEANDYVMLEKEEVGNHD